MVEIKDITAKTINDIFMLFSKNSLHPSLGKESLKLLQWYSAILQLLAPNS